MKLMVNYGAKMELLDITQIEKLHEESMQRDLITNPPGEEWTIPIGASNIIGTLGFVNAAFEVKN